MSNLNKNQTKAIVSQDTPHYYEVRIPNHPNGIPKMHCGRKRDADSLLEKYPDATVEKIYLPHPPLTVDVPHVRVAPDLELPMQQILPESQLEPLDLEL
jgi:hypothetical protein